jgi:uncharacterized repeat protein (TIGR01451 family)
MLSLRKLFNLIGQDRPMGRPAVRRTDRRRLKLEHLENRQLLANNLGAITGAAFTDTDDDGVIDTGETRLQNVTIELFRDVDNDDVFEPGGADGTAIQNDTTDAQGEYRFDGLTAGRYFVRQVAGSGTSAGLLLRESVLTVEISAGQAAGEDSTIDDYNEGDGAGNAQLVTGTPGNSDGSGASLVDVLGGERDLFVDNDAGSAGNIELEADGGGFGINRLRYAFGGATGTVLVTYDGDADTSAGQKGTMEDGLADFDLTEGGTRDRFQFSTTNDAAYNLVLRVRSGGATFTVTTNVAANPSDFSEVLVPFASFTGADFTQIDAIQIEIAEIGANSLLDGFFEFVGTLGPSVVDEQNFANLNPMSIGDRVFRDLNNNGVFDTGESGINSVIVQLFLDADGDGVLDPTETAVLDSNGAAITDTTDTNGLYLLEDILPSTTGETYIVVIANNQTSLQNLTSSTGNNVGNAAPDPDDNVNSDDNGTEVVVGANTLTVSGGLFLIAGQEPITDGDTNANTNLTLDFGFDSDIDLAVTKTSAQTTIDAGGRITYTINVTNNGPATATNVEILDDLPTGVTFLPNGTSGSTSSTSWTQQANVNAELRATIASLASGASQSFTVVVSSSASLAIGTLVNATTVDSDGVDSDLSNNQDDFTTTLTRNAVLTLTKVDNRSTVSPNDQFTYVLTVTNTGLSTANNVTLADVLPAGYTFVSFGAGSQGNPVRTTDGGTGRDRIDATVTSLGVGATMVVNVLVEVDDNFTGTTITNTATADSDDSASVTATDTNTFTDNRYDLSISKDNGITSVVAGQTALVTYTLTITNDGPGTANNVTISDTLPAALEFVSATRNGNSVGTANGQAYSANIGSLTDNQSTTISLVVRIRSSATGTSINNVSTVTADSANTLELDTTDNTDNDQDTLSRTVALQITKNDSADPITAGSNFTYTITAFNSGPSDAPSVVFSDPLPSGVTFRDGTFIINENPTRSGTVTFNTTTNRLEANLGTLLGNGSSTVNRAVITLNVTAAATASGTVNNTATLTNADGTVSDSETTTINPSFDLTITKSDGVSTITTGQNLTYTIIVTNAGPSTASNVTVSDVLPSTLTFVSASSSSGTFTNNGGTVSGTIASIASGATATVTIIANVKNDTPDNATISNTATVSAANESTTTNNSATDTVTVQTFGSVSGFAYIDLNRNGRRDSTDLPLSGVTVQLTGTLSNGTAITARTATTGADGSYLFSEVRPGTYSVTQTQPTGFVDGAETAGTRGGNTSVNDLISAIPVIAGVNSDSNTFGEIRTFSKRAYLR